ncbi:MAG: hypothetical protein V3R86_03055 [Candidatus Hydrothermarchaeaceae archaeon]
MTRENFRPNFDIDAFIYDGVGPLEIGNLGGADLNLLQEDLSRKIEEKQKQTKSSLDSLGISIDREALHEEIERIMNMDNDALDAYEREIKTKLAQKKMEMEKILKSR